MPRSEPLLVVALPVTPMLRRWSLSDCGLGFRGEILALPLRGTGVGEFDLIKDFLSSVLVLKAPKRGSPFRLYITAENRVIGAVLAQESEGKEHVVTYLSPRLVDAKTRYTLIENLCFCLFYACTKL